MISIAFANNKGGVGKTTLSVFFALHLIDRGYRVVLSDWDDQANLSYSMQGDERFEHLPLADFIRGEEAASGKNHLLLSATDDLIAVSKDDETHDLSERFSQLALKHDIHIMDMPPGSSERLYIGLELCNKVVVPMSVSAYSLASSLRFFTIMEKVDNSKFAGFILNLVDRQDRDLQGVRGVLEDKLLTTIYRHKEIERLMDPNQIGSIHKRGSGQARVTKREIQDAMEAIEAQLTGSQMTMSA